MKKVITLLFVCASIWSANAQLCEPSETCDEALLICGSILNEYEGMTTPPSFPPQPIPTFCGTLDNPNWFGFVPCEPNVSLDIVVGNCISFPPDIGLQAAIVQVPDCNGAFVLNCVEQIFPGSSFTFQTGGLVPGNIYYLIIDGYSGDLCDYQIFINEGINTVDPELQQTQAGFIDGPTSMPCGGGVGVYTANPPTCEPQATDACYVGVTMDCFYYEWIVPNGAIILGDPTAQTIEVQFPPGIGGEISVDFLWDEDSCGDPSCFCEICPADDIPPIFVTGTPSTVNILPPLEICEGEEFEFCGENYSAENSETLSCQVGCETTLQDIVVLDGAFANITQTGDLGNDPSVLLENEFFNVDDPIGYFWEGPGINISNANDFTQEVTEAGIYTLTVTNQVSGCTGMAQTIVLPGTPCVSTDSPIAPGDSCSNAPPFCESYLNTFCSVNAFYNPDDPGVLSCQIENNQWLSFIACDEDVEIEISVSNCLQAEGLEVSILQSFDCESFSVFADCENISDGSTATVTVSGLSPGLEYLLMVDGINGDICQWEVVSTVGVSNGGTFQEDNTPGQVTGPTGGCLDEPFFGTYTFTPPECNLIPLGGCPAATQQFCTPDPDVLPCTYDTLWTITPAGIAQFVNGDSTGATVEIFVPDTIDIPPGQTLNFTLAVNPFHVVNPNPGGEPCNQDCFSGCATIIPGDPCVVLPLEIEFCQPDVQEYYFMICEGECIDFNGQTFCGAGFYSFTQIDECGCEDMINLIIEEEPLPFPPIVGAPITACAPDGATYSVSFDIINFDPDAFVYVNGVPFNGTTYTESGIPSGTPFEYEVFTASNCGISAPISVSGVEECPCIPQTFNEGLITLCPGDCYDLAGDIYCLPGPYEVEVFNPLTGCTDTYIFEIENIQEADLATGSLTELCNALNTEYTVTFTITDGVEPYFVNGDALAGNTYQSDPIPSGDAYAFTVTDSGICGNDQINLEGAYTCDCLTDPGTMSSSNLSTCEDEMVSSTWNNDATLDGDDILVFVLHTGSGTTIGDILGMNVTGAFGFEPGSMEFETEYYISAVAGNDMGGTVDLGDVCLGVSAGQPVVFYENPEFDILPTNEITCDDNEAPLDAFPTAGSGTYTFEWNGPGLSTSGQSAVATQSGTFTCVMTDVLSGCTAETSIVVDGDAEVPVFDVIPSSGELTCDVESILLETTTGQAGLNFEWTSPSGGNSGTEIIADEPGEYTVVATAANGCTSEVVINVSQDITPPEDLTSTDGVLTCDEPVTDLSVSSSTLDVDFTWIFPTGNESMGASVTTDIEGQYTIIATSANGCTSEITTQVVDLSDPPENVQATEGILTCDNPTANLIAQSTTPDVTFTWVFPTGDEMDGDEITTNISGDYTIIAMAPNGCSTQIPSVVYDMTEPPEDVMAINGELNCLQSTAMLQASSSTPDVTFTWVFPTGDEMDGATVSTNVEGDYLLIVTAPNGCTLEVPAEVVDNSEAPSLTLTDGAINCTQPEVELNAESDMADVIFTWTFPDGTSAQGTMVNTSQSGMYEVLALAPNGCETILTTMVAEVPDPILTAELGIQTPTCAGDEDGMLMVGLTAGGTAPYSLTLDGVPFDGNVFENLPAGFYTLNITDASGCETAETIQLPDPLFVTVDLGDDISVDLGDPIVLNFETDIDPNTINWFGPNGETWNGVSSLTIPAMTNGIYGVEIADANGCSASDEVQVFVNGTGEVFVPNVFSPNGDEVNDILTVFAGKDVTLVRSFSIFDRWGDMVFQDENFAPQVEDTPPTRGWDGTMNGKELDPAVFVFMAEVEFKTGEVKMISGDVVLVK